MASVGAAGASDDRSATLRPRGMSNAQLFERAQRVIPGGVNSPVRAFRAVGGTPPFIARAEGAYMVDAEGRRYIDYIGSWGPMILGHGHPAVLEAVRRALAELFPGGAGRPELWLYRGAWQEWQVTDATWLVPLAQEELRLKIQAIFKHQSQKDSAPFPGGHDDREFWQRVEARNKETAALLDRLGLAEYFAVEAYVVER